MQKINHKFKNLKKLILIKSIFVFILFTILNLSNLNFSYAQSGLDNTIPNISTANKAAESIEGLTQNGSLVNCNTSSNPRPCTPADFFHMGGVLVKMAVFIIIISIGMGGIIIGAMYPFYGDNASWREKMKKRLWNMFWGVLITVLAASFIFAFIKALGGNGAILDVVKKLISTNILETTYAQDIAGALQQAANSTSENGQYTNFFGTKDPIILLYRMISFIVSYVVVPALILAIIWTGFLFIKAQGNEKEIEEAKKWALRCVIGILIAVSANFIAELFFNSVENILKK